MAYSITYVVHFHKVVLSLNICPDDFSKNSWVGIFVINREKSENYVREKRVKTVKDEIVFENLVSGMYEIRYFYDNKSCLLNYTKTLLIGEEIVPESVEEVSSVNCRYLVVKFPPLLKQNDWFALFKAGEKSQKKFLRKWIVHNTTQLVYNIEVGDLNLEPKYIDDLFGVKTTDYEIRYFKARSKVIDPKLVTYSFPPSGIYKIALKDSEKDTIQFVGWRSLNQLCINYSTYLKNFEVIVRNDQQVVSTFRNELPLFFGTVTFSLPQMIYNFSIDFVSPTTHHIIQTKNLHPIV
ncbi:hypothetical protein EIN_411090 [Entamoeba invadens IP1]|uniref:Uncharacterized protein n=1 Tax=Entamoeba invadens IP1 TaxID=370355 RepID=A0A0A1U4G5_ENTIV|nr:hypothetical protein EIN_411090 [Entamoeba invadens IP1]ELP87756.1 hypothetical protein EIN_411090 [Entamoeba invadens IP1]|eukprot:XP_004254527.1 hypothetical protein EIN_411090 [Entamoeba invadens IP1]